MYTGPPLVVHDRDQCIGQHCCIHNPSDHALNDRPLNWRQDRHLMERVCEHGIGHPDPDDLAYKRGKIGDDLVDNYGFGVHSCDGCCRSAPPEKRCGCGTTFCGAP